MKITYPCYANHNNQGTKWEGTLLPFKLTEPYEVEIISRGSVFHLIIGSYKHGKYLCIPNWNVGTDLSRLSDRFWNLEKLLESKRLSKEDACSVIYGLSELDKLLKA